MTMQYTEVQKHAPQAHEQSAITGRQRAGHVPSVRQKGRESQFSQELFDRVNTYLRGRDSTRLTHDAMVLRYGEELSPGIVERTLTRTLGDSMMKWTILKVGSNARAALIPAILAALPAGYLVGELRRLRLLPSVWIVRLFIYLMAIGGACTAAIALRSAPPQSLFEYIAAMGFPAMIAVAALLLVYRWIDRRRTTLQRIASVVKRYESADKRTWLVEAICDSITRMEKPIAMFLPDYAHLDDLSRNVIRELLGSSPRRAVGIMLWVIVEPAANATASADLREHSRGAEIVAHESNLYELFAA